MNGAYMITQNKAHEILDLLEESSLVDDDEWLKEEIEFIKEFNFEGIENHWFIFRQLERLEELANKHLGGLPK